MATSQEEQRPALSCDVEAAACAEFISDCCPALLICPLVPHAVVSTAVAEHVVAPYVLPASLIVPSAAAVFESIRTVRLWHTPAPAPASFDLFADDTALEAAHLPDADVAETSSTESGPGVHVSPLATMMAEHAVHLQELHVVVTAAVEPFVEGTTSKPEPRNVSLVDARAVIRARAPQLSVTPSLMGNDDMMAAYLAGGGGRGLTSLSFESAAMSGVHAIELLERAAPSLEVVHDAAVHHRRFFTASLELTRPSVGLGDTGASGAGTCSDVPPRAARPRVDCGGLTKGATEGGEGTSRAAMVYPVLTELHIPLFEENLKVRQRLMLAFTRRQMPQLRRLVITACSDKGDMDAAKLSSFVLWLQRQAETHYAPFGHVPVLERVIRRS